jgi:predicted XRE-type DNA-binding protein
MKVTKSSGNVFVDLGFDPVEAETLAVKADLVTLVARAIRLRKLTQTEAAKLCGIDQGTLSKALGGKLHSITIERLAKWLLALGWNVTIEAAPLQGGHGKRRGAFSVHAG